MIVFESTFIAKVLLAAMVKAGYKKDELTLEFDKTNHDIFSFELYGRTFIVVNVQTSRVSEIPVNIRIIKMSVDSSDLLKIVQNAVEVFGDRAKFFLE